MVKLDQVASAHARTYVKFGFCAVCAMILLMSVGCCKQRGGGGDGGGREPGAQVSFGVELSNHSYNSLEHADVTIGGKLICSVQQNQTSSVFLPAGEYRIRVSADGYEAVERDISIKNSPTQSFHFKLKRPQ